MGNIDFTAQDSLTPLQRAAIKNSVNDLEKNKDQILKLVTETTDLPPDISCSALMFAARYDSAEAVQYLLDQEKLYRCQGNHVSAIHIAARYNSIRALELLIHTDEIRLTVLSGENALMIAAEYGNLGCVKLLWPLLAGEKTNGKTALMIAAEKGQLQILQWIIDNDTEHREIGQTDASGRNAFELSLHANQVYAGYLLRTVEKPSTYGELISMYQKDEFHKFVLFNNCF